MMLGMAERVHDITSMGRTAPREGAAGAPGDASDAGGRPADTGRAQGMERGIDMVLAIQRPVVLAGDWNVVPEDRDVFSASRMAHDALLQPETRAAWRRILHQGWTDALRMLHPREERLYTFWDYTAGCWQRDAGFRIDHLLLSPVAADRLQAAGVDRWARGEEKASDHAPTWVVLS